MEATTSIRGDARAEWLSNNRDAAKILDTYLAQAEEAFKRRIQEAGLNLTGELLASFRQRAAVEARLEMVYWRESRIYAGCTTSEPHHCWQWSTMCKSNGRKRAIKILQHSLGTG